ncbi:MAG: hypothetical protein ORN54_00055, partial [Cyclobacteriaceae bacterium]|nr:hypothetical protein [Cyclobacteriaceae bacterium]
FSVVNNHLHTARAAFSSTTLGIQLLVKCTRETHHKVSSQIIENCLLQVIGCGGLNNLSFMVC